MQKFLYICNRFFETSLGFFGDDKWIDVGIIFGKIRVPLYSHLYETEYTLEVYSQTTVKNFVLGYCTIVVAF